MRQEQTMAQEERLTGKSHPVSSTQRIPNNTRGEISRHESMARSTLPMFDLFICDGGDVDIIPKYARSVLIGRPNCKRQRVPTCFRYASKCSMAQRGMISQHKATECKQVATTVMIDDDEKSAAVAAREQASPRQHEPKTDFFGVCRCRPTKIRHSLNGHSYQHWLLAVTSSLINR